MDLVHKVKVGWTVGEWYLWLRLLIQQMEVVHHEEVCLDLQYDIFSYLPFFLFLTCNAFLKFIFFAFVCFCFEFLCGMKYSKFIYSVCSSCDFYS